jgi:hypothetical protein
MYYFIIVILLILGQTFKGIVKHHFIKPRYDLAMKTLVRCDDSFEDRFQQKFRTCVVSYWMKLLYLNIKYRTFIEQLFCNVCDNIYNYFSLSVSSSQRCVNRDMFR